MPKDMPIGRRIVLWREHVGISQIDLANALNVNASSVSRWESGRNDPSMDNLEAIARAIRIPLAKFFGDVPGVAKGAA